ncbi:MAG: thioredoxin family protein [Haloarculaceae archaeon]
MNEHTIDVPSTATFAEEPETRLAFLEDAGVLAVSEDDEVTTTVPFEDTRSIYLDTYTEVSQGQLVETVADLFGVSPEAARERIEADEITANEVATYLSLRSFLDVDLPVESLALLAELVAPVGIGSPVPADMRELTDQTYREGIEEAGDIVVFVWKYPCDPCRRMKGELPTLLHALPADLATAGVDGDSVGEIRREFDVDTAPSVLLFEDGDLVDVHEGYTSLANIAEAIGDAYGSVEVTVTADS